MKKLTIVCLLICSLVSCSKNEKNDLNTFPQKWMLVRMYGGIHDTEVTGKDMEWQEYYILNANGTFIKHRERAGQITEASGIFNFTDVYNVKHIEFEYSVKNEIIGSCYSTSLKEIVLIKTDTRLLNTWFDCDGPGLEYERLK